LFLKYSDGPKYAGASGAISHPAPPDNLTTPFSIFMRRVNRKGGILGWEYCGEYITQDDGLGDWLFGVPSKGTDKSYLVENMKTSLRSAGGYWHRGIARHRKRVKDVLMNYPASKDAESLISLGLDKDGISDENFAEKIVHWEKFLSHTIVQFVSYDENMYDFVKEGETTHNKHGKKMKSGEPCAKASDWYNELDKMAEGVRD
jgi:hypothetical protein